MSKSIPPSADGASAASAAAAAAAAAPSSPASPFPPAAPPATDYYGTPTLVHAASIAAAVLGPVGLLLPPRRMGLRSLLLAGGTFFATSQLTYDYTGQSIYQRFRHRAGQFSAGQQEDLPAAALQRQAAMRAERERRRLLAEGKQETAVGSEKGEKEDWIRERARRERETLEAGGGYWDLIVDQISEVVADLRGGPGKKGDGGGAEVAKSDDSKK